MRARLTRRTLEAFAGIDAALTVSNMDPTFRIDDAEACSRAYPRQARQPFNVTGQPAIAIPAGFTQDGLPLSLQLDRPPLPGGDALPHRPRLRARHDVDEAAPAGDVDVGRVKQRADPTPAERHSCWVFASLDPTYATKTGYKNFSKWYRRMPPPSVLLLAASAISSRTRR